MKPKSKKNRKYNNRQATTQLRYGDWVQRRLVTLEADLPALRNDIAKVAAHLADITNPRQAVSSALQSQIFRTQGCLDELNRYNHWSIEKGEETIRIVADGQVSLTTLGAYHAALQLLHKLREQSGELARWVGGKPQPLEELK